MSQTLTLLSATNVPPLITDSEGLVANMASVENLAPKQLKSIACVALIHAVAQVLGAPNYINDHPAAIQGAQTFLGGISHLDDVEMGKQIWQIQAVLAWNTGKNADATLSSDVNALLKEARDFIELPEETLTRLYLALFYGMSV